MREIIETKNAPSRSGHIPRQFAPTALYLFRAKSPSCRTLGTVVEGDIAEQTRQVMKNLSAILDAAGIGLGKVVKTTVYLVNLEDFSKFNQVYGEYFADARPARATVQVARLPKEVLVEIEAIAAA